MTTVQDTPQTQEQEQATFVGEQIARIAGQIGEQPERISVKNPDWMTYLDEGVIVTPHIKRYRAQEEITLEDLGIKPTSKEERDAYSRVFSLGNRFLLPKEVLKEAQTLDDRGRNWLERCSFKTFWGRFVHVKMYPTWAAKNLEIRDEYMALARNIGDRYEFLVAQMAADLRAVAPDILNRLEQSGLSADEIGDRNLWIDRFVGRAIDKIPPADEIVASFQYNWDVQILPLQETVAADMVRANRLRAEAEALARLQAEEAMRADLERSAAERATQGIDRFVADVKDQIYSFAYGACVDALEAIKSDGKIAKGDTKKLNNLIQMATSMVFWSDPNLEEKVTELRALVNVPAAKRDTSNLEVVLRDLAAEARLTLLDVQRPPQRSAREFGVPDSGIELERIVRRGSQVDWSESAALDSDEMGRRAVRRTAADVEYVF